MVRQSHLIGRKITVNKEEYILVTAAKAHKCDECGWLIQQGMLHYINTELKDKLFPDRVHVHCIEKYLKVGGK